MLYLTTVIQPNNGAKTGEVMKRFFLVRCSLIFKENGKTKLAYL